MVQGQRPLLDGVPARRRCAYFLSHTKSFSDELFEKQKLRKKRLPKICVFSIEPWCHGHINIARKILI